MAELAVNIVINKLIPLLRDEVKLQRGVHSEIASIKDQLELIRAYVKDADAKAEMSNTTSYVVKEWVKQVREVSYRIQDVIDEYLFNVGKPRQTKGLAGVFAKIAQLLKTVILSHKITYEIGNIKQSIMRLNEGRQTYGFNPSVSESSHHGEEVSTRNDLRLGALFMDDAQLVGVDHTRKLLTDWLLNKDSRRTVISVIGQGGLGKTAIVSSVYKKQKEERSFDCYAWITVSRSLKPEQLLKTVMQSFHENDDNRYAAMKINEIMDKETLTNKVIEYLQGRRYMIVFDDVWDINFWEFVEFALPNNNKSGRIMITTRDRGVAEFCARSAPLHIHELEPLPPNDALSLFHLTAFQFDPQGQGCPKDLIEWSQGFVNKCDGVPLAIVAVAGLLSTKKKTVSEWQRIYDRLHSKLTSDPHLRSYHQVLSESYNDLPYHLKLCLLYFGLFPEDYSITCAKLINLWIAEGFVTQNGIEDQTLREEIAEEYLAELIRRSLIKVSEVYPYGRVRRCRVHDLMHDFILKKCEELNFCQVKKNEGSHIHALTRRLSIHTNIIDDTQQSTTNYSKVRSCFVFNFKELSKPVAESLFSSFKLLIALDLEAAPLDYLPEAVGNLFNLKYLSLRNTKIRTIPKFIGKLQKLETLDLKLSQVRELPVEVNKLVKLRLLIAYYFHWEIHFSEGSLHGVKLKEGIGCLKALQKLSMIDATDGDVVINELKNLKQIQKLAIVKIRRHQGKILCKSIESMNHLCSLGIAAAEENEFLDLQLLNDPPQYLQRLYLKGRLERLPEWIPKLKNLVKLRLNWSRLMEDPIPILKDLPELLEVVLLKSFEGDEFHFKDGWFRKLKSLELLEMQGLSTLTIDKGALPSLEALRLNRCPQLVEVPTSIQNLETLKLFHLEEMPDEIISSLRLKEGKSYDKIKEITIVTSSSHGFYRHKL